MNLTVDHIKKICPSAQRINISKYIDLLNELQKLSKEQLRELRSFSK